MYSRTTEGAGSRAASFGLGLAVRRRAARRGDAPVNERGAAKAPRLSCDDVLLHGLVQAQIGHDLLELAVLFLGLTQPPQLRRPDAAALLVPDVEVASLMPIWRHTSSSLMPSSACFSAAAICSSVNSLFLMA